MEFSKMKTYLLDIPNKYNRFSKNLDVKAILCNKSWRIFNDSGDKELYIFQENGSLITSVNGNVTNATWQYISANNSLVISFKEQSFMLHPSFKDDAIFVLQQDGTERFVFLIEERQSNLFHPKSLKELTAYFANRERRKIENRQQEKRISNQQQETKRKEIRKFQSEQERQRKEEEREEEILKSYNYYLKFGIIAGLIFILYVVLFIIYYPPTHNFKSFMEMVFTFCALPLPLVILATIIDIRLRNRILRRYNQK